eukprot:113842_1
MHVPSGQMMPPTAQTISQCRLLNCCRRQVMMSSKQTPVMTPVSSTSEIPVSGEHTENYVPIKEVREPSHSCQTCSSNHHEGPGHFGRIELTRPRLTLCTWVLADDSVGSALCLLQVLSAALQSDSDSIQMEPPAPPRHIPCAARKGAGPT